MNSDDIQEGLVEATANVKEVKLLRPTTTGIDFCSGGLSQPTCIGHFVFIDCPNEVAYLVPMNRTGMNGMIGLMEKILKEDDTPDASGPSGEENQGSHDS